MGLASGSLIPSLMNNVRRHDFSLVVVASCHPDTLRRYLSIAKEINKFTKIVFIDGGDWAEVAGDLDRLGGKELYEEALAIRPFDYIFKREYIVDRSYADNVYPLPLAFNFDRMPIIDKQYKYDVAFWAVESDPIRSEALALIENRFDCSSNGTVKNQVMKKYKRKGDYYLQELSRCKISLNFRGAGWDTLRYWEVPALGGFMISQKPGILIKNNFVNEKEIVYCNDDLSDLVGLCEYYLKNDDKREAIAKNSLAKMKAFHTDQHRAKEVLEISGYSS